MGLITNEVEVKLSPTNIKHFQQLGYTIPKLKKYNWGSIVVKVEDLLPTSGIIIERQCDDCKEIKKVTYHSYSINNHNGKCYCHVCASKKMRRENNPNWKFDKTEEERCGLRLIDGYDNFIKTVLHRDNYTCLCCGKSISGKMAVHHLNGYNWFIEGRTDPNNGVTLCENCHENFHSLYGKGDNTKEQFEEWLGMSIEIIKYSGELPSARKVFCIEDDIIYNNPTEAMKANNIKSLSSIYNVCNRREIHKEYKKMDGTVIKYSSPCLTLNGKHFIWYDVYIKMTDEERCSYLCPNPHFKKIICLTTGEIFECIKDAKQKYNCSSHIGDCCNGKRETCGQLQDGTRLKWMYYDEYIKKCNDDLFNNDKES